jgi:hypothetical protein
MANLFKEEVVVGGQQLMVKERIAEGGFGFVDLVFINIFISLHELTT